MNYDLGAAKGEIVIGYDGKGVDQAKSGLSSLSSAGSSVASAISGAFGSAAMAVGAFAGTIATIAISGGIARQLKIEDAQAKLKGLGNDTERVEEIMNSALASVEGTAYGLDTAATVAATAVAAGIEPGQELEKYLRLTADAATIAGTSMEEMGSIINKTTTAGIVQADNLNQLADRGIPIFQWLAEEYGVTQEALRKMVSSGEVDSETFRRVIEQNIGGAALESGNTTRGAFANMMAALSRTGQALTSGIFPYFKDFFNGIREGINNLNNAVGPIAEQIGQTIGPKLGEMGQKIADFFANIDFNALIDGIKGVSDYIAPLAGLLIGSMGPLMTNIPIIGGLFRGLTGPIGLAVGIVIALMNKFPELRRVAGDVIGGLVDGIKGFIDAFTSADGSLSGATGFQGLMETLGSLARVILPLVESAIGLVVDAIVYLVDNWDQVSTTAGVVVAALSPLIAILAAIRIQMAITAAGGFLTWILNITKLAPIWSAVTKGVAAAQRLLNAAMAANPIGLIIVAITALVAAFIYLWNTNEGFRNFFIGMWDGIKAAAGAVADWFTGTFLPALASVWEGIKTGFATVGDFFVGLWDGIKLGVQAFADWINGIWTTITETASAAWEGFSAMLSEVWSRIEPIVTGPLQLWETIFSTVWETIKTIVATAIVFIEGLLTGNMKTMSGAISAGWEKIKSLWSGAFDRIKSISSNAWNAVKSIFSSAWSAITSAVSAAWGKIKSFFSNGFSAVRSLVSNGWNAAKRLFSEGVNASVNFVRELPGKIRSALSNLTSTLSNIAKAAWDGFKRAVETGINNAVNFIKTLPSKIKGALSGAGNWLTSIGRNVMQGFINGTKAMAKRLSDAVLAPIRNAVNGAKRFLGIASPSKLLHGMGEDTGEGYEQGIAAREKGIAAAARSAAEAAADNFSTKLRLTTEMDSFARLASQLRGATAGFGAHAYAGAPAPQIVQHNQYNYPVAERDSRATDRALQLASEGLA